MTARVGEIGRIIQVNANFDLSGNSDLELIFTKPDNTTLTVNKAGGVSAPAVASGDFLANEYFQYSTQTGNLDQTGNWQVNGRYIDATPKEFCGDPAFFFVDTCP